jgi:hypothetical protein
MYYNFTNKTGVGANLWGPGTIRVFDITSNDSPGPDPGRLSYTTQSERKDLSGPNTSLATRQLPGFHSGFLGAGVFGIKQL